MLLARRWHDCIDSKVKCWDNRVSCLVNGGLDWLISPQRRLSSVGYETAYETSSPPCVKRPHDLKSDQHSTNLVRNLPIAVISLCS